MAQSPTAADGRSESTDEYQRAWTTIGTLLLSGRSWSGLERNCCYLNTGESRFTDVSAVSDLNFIEDARAVAAVDWDLDGDLDLWIVNRNAPRVRFVQNRMPRDHHFLSVKLQGTNCNRDAIGARLELFFADEQKPSIVKTLRAGEGFLSQSSKWVHFGLGKRNQIEKLVVRWPGSRPETFRGLEADRRYEIVEGREPAVWSRFSAVDLQPSEQSIPVPSAKSRVVLNERLPMPPLDYLSFDNKLVSLNDHRGEPLLINLWASWCAPCLSELTDLKQHEQRLRSAGLNVVAVNIEGLEAASGRSDRPAQTTLDRLGFPFEGGLATRKLATQLERGPGMVLNMNAPLPIPSSFLIDREDRLAAIYTGPVSAEQILADLKLLDAGHQELLAASVPFPGRWLVDFAPPTSDGDGRVPAAGKAGAMPAASAWRAMLPFVWIAFLIGCIIIYLANRRRKGESRSTASDRNTT